MFREIAKFSNNIFFSIIVAAIGGFLSELLQIKLLLVVFGVLFVAAFFVSWITPDIFVITRKPWLAHAWLYGINPIWTSRKPWHELSGFTKIGILVHSLLLASLGTVGLFMVVVNILNP